MDIRVVIAGFAADPESGDPVVILATDEGFLVPIHIGPYEARAILLGQARRAPPRPLTHNLLESVIAKLESAVEKIVITDLDDGTYYAKLHLRNKSGGIVEVDCRPSDALALASQVRCPMFMTEELFVKLRSREPLPADVNAEVQKLLDALPVKPETDPTKIA